jgi:hypothetical protein
VSDVVAAALIAGLVGLLGTVASLILTRWNMRDQAQQREEVRRQARNDLVRSARQEHYAQLAWLLNRLHKYADLGLPPSEADWTDRLDQYAFSSGLMTIVSSAPVDEGVRGFTAALERAAPDLLMAVSRKRQDIVGHGINPWTEAYRKHEEALEVARIELLTRMRHDVGAS